MLGRLADGVARGVEGAMAQVSGAFLEPVVRLGVTGLSRAGKTVFITALVANLMDRARMPQLRAAGRIEAAFLQPQPDVTLPRFDYEAHLAALTGPAPHWPDSTRNVAELRLSLRVRPSGLFAALRGPRTLHVDIIDYPGEWLLDLALLDRSYADWSEAALTRASRRAGGADFMALARAEDGALRLEEPKAQALAAGWTGYLRQRGWRGGRTARRGGSCCRAIWRGRRC